MANIVWFSWKDTGHPKAGGAEVVSDQLLQRLAKDGHTVTLVTARYNDSEHESDQNGYHIARVPTRLGVYFHAWRYYRQNLKFTTDFVIDECNTLPFFAEWYSGTRGTLFVHQLCRQIWFYQLPWAFGLLGYLAEPIYLRFLHRWPVVTVSNSTKKDLHRHGFKNREVTVMTQGITMQPGSAQKYDKPTVLSLGSIRSMKRTMHQLRAFEHAKQTIADLQLIIAGDASGPYGKNVLRAAAASPFADSITIKGRVNAAEKRELMQRAHALLVTSVKEGWGLVVSEAASQGTPSVAYNVDGLRDSVLHHKTGILTQPTPNALAHGIIQLLTADEEAYDKMAADGQAFSETLTFDAAYEDFKEATNL